MEPGGPEHAVQHLHQHEVAAKGKQDVGQPVEEAAQPVDRRRSPHLRSSRHSWMCGSNFRHFSSAAAPVIRPGSLLESCSWA